MTIEAQPTVMLPGAPETVRSYEMPTAPRAVFFDIDGTACPNNAGAQPSEGVTGTIAETQKLDIHVGAMTGRPLFQARELFGTLHGPSILHGGAIIADLSTGEILRSYSLDPQSMKAIEDMITPSIAGHVVEVISTEGYVPLSNKKNLDGDPLEVYITALDETAADALIAELNELTTIAAHKLISYTEDKIDISVTHALARKDTALFEAAEMLGIPVSSIIGIGDGFNDLAWLQHCGLSAAVDNAIGELKQVVDYVAPSVDDDGVAHVLRRFCLARQ